MQKQVTITNDPTLGLALSGRQIKEIISESSSSRDLFADWFSDRIDKLNLVENKDYIRTAIRVPTKTRAITEYMVSVPAAIRIAEWQTSKRGMPLANYLKAYQHNPQASVLPAVPEVPGLFPDDVPTNRQAPIMADVVRPNDSHADEPTGMTIPRTPAQLLLEQAMQLVEEEKKRAEELQPAPADNGPIIDRLNALESKVNSLLTIFQQAGALAVPVTPEVKEADPAVPPTTRVLLTRLVNTYAAADRKSEQDTWRYLYGQFSLRTGIDTYVQPASKSGGQSYLSAIESSGQIDNLFSLAKRLFVLPALR